MKTRTSLILCAVAVLAFVAVQPIQAADNTWNTGTGDWDYATSNWTAGTWTNGDNAVFGGTANSTITIAMPGVTVGKMTFNVDGDTIAASGLNSLLKTSKEFYMASGVTATISAPITSTAGTGMYNGGTLVLSGANTITGTAYYSSGTIRLGASGAASTGLVQMGWANGNCMFDLNGFDQTVDRIQLGACGAGYTHEIKTNGGTLTLLGNIDGDNGYCGQTKLISGTAVGGLDLGGGTRTVNSTNGSGLQISAIISNGGLTNKQNGLLLSGANTFAGNMTLDSGSLRMGVDSVGAVGAVVSSAIGTGTLVFDNGTISSDSTAARTIYNAVSFTSDNNARLGDATMNGTLTFKAPIALTADRSFYFNSPVVFEGGFTGSGTFMKYGAADYTLGSHLGVNIGVGEGKLITSGANIINGKILKFVTVQAPTWRAEE